MAPVQGEPKPFRQWPPALPPPPPPTIEPPRVSKLPPPAELPHSIVSLSENDKEYALFLQASSSSKGSEAPSNRQWKRPPVLVSPESEEYPALSAEKASKRKKKEEIFAKAAAAEAAEVAAAASSYLTRRRDLPKRLKSQGPGQIWEIARCPETGISAGDVFTIAPMKGAQGVLWEKRPMEG